MTRRLVLASVCCLLLAASGPAAAEHHEAGEHGEHGDVPIIQVVSTLVGGKNVYIPSTIIVLENQAVKLSIFNTTEIPHGFQIPSLGIETVLVEQQETLVEIPALESGKVHPIRCQLHPAHRAGTLAVLDAD